MAFIATEKLSVLSVVMSFCEKNGSGSVYLSRLQRAAPYTGAKAHFVIDSVDDHNLMAKFISATYNELPIPKPKKKKVSLMEK